MFKAQYSNIQKPPLGAQLDRTHPLARNLIGLWIFNESVNSRRITDLYKGNVGLLQPDTSWAIQNGKAGARFIDTTGFYGVAGQNNLWNGSFSDGWTMIWWVFPLDTIGWPFGLGSVGGTDQALHGDLGDTSLNFNLYGDDHTITIPANLATLNRVCMVALGQTRGALKFVYVDGRLAGTVQAGGIFNPNGVWAFGRWAVDQGFAWNGILYYASVYNRALTESEIQWLYREPYTMISP